MTNESPPVFHPDSELMSIDSTSFRPSEYHQRSDEQLYPEEYGEWPGTIADVPTEEQLFDRQRVADIIHNDI